MLNCPARDLLRSAEHLGACSTVTQLNLNQPLDGLSPGKLGALYREARGTRLAMQKRVDAVEAFEKACQERIIAQVPADQGFVADGYSFVVVSKEVPTIKDWDAVLAHIGQTGRFDFLTKKLAEKAVTDTENWHLIPGIQRFNALKLSVTKR